MDKDLYMFEAVFILKPGLEEELRKTIVNSYRAHVEKYHGYKAVVDEWGERCLAYPIEKYTAGYFVCMKFLGKESDVEELRRVFSTDATVIKYISIKHDEIDYPVEPADISSGSKCEQTSTPTKPVDVFDLIFGLDK